MIKKIHQCLEKLEIPDGCLQCRWDPIDFFILHSHDFWEIPIQIKGATQHKLNGKTFSLIPQSCLLISPKHLHQIMPCDTSFYALNTVISDSFMKACCEKFSSTLYKELLNVPLKTLYLSNGQFSVIKDFQTKLQILPANSPQRKIIQQMLLSYFIELFYNNNFININKCPQVIKDFIHLASLPENINIKPSQISELTNYSYSYFSILFKNATGQTLNKFLTDTKMKYAYTQLGKSSDVSMLDLSLSLGYSSLSHFIHLFKNYYGAPPSFFRKIHTTTNQTEK